MLRGGRRRLAARPFDSVTELLQGWYQQIPVFTLDLDDAIFDGAACATFFFQLAGKLSELIGGKR